ncbi:MAG: FAD-binding protein, partial [Chlamydiota bacterium]|nr:FAD-binding protein [Chlamydiota bacterium]
MTKPVDCVQISSFLYRLKGSLLINAPLKNHTTMRVGGPATLLYYPVQQEDLIKAIQFLNKAHTEWMIAGNMSNTIFSDKGYSGCLISLKKMNHFYFEKTVLVANAGAMWPTLCKASMEKDLGGLEFTCGIPGTVGAGVRINAGAEGHEVSDIL